VKEEFAPSDRTVIAKKQQSINDLIAPHFRLIQFFSSHFSATQLSSTHIERLFFRMMRTTLASMRKAPEHPLAREAHFHIVLLAIRVLANCTGSNERARWLLKDQILSAGLAWFSNPSRWSFGSNKLQVKAEVQLMSDVLAALQYTANLGAKPMMPLLSLQPKQELLTHLLASEITRLGVWIAPLAESNSGSRLTLGGSGNGDNDILHLLKIAWGVDASLAVHLALRSHSQRVQGEIRSQLLRNPEKALDEPEALQLLLGNTLPGDVSFQLKVSVVMASRECVTNKV